jgi:hypothetical protein
VLRLANNPFFFIHSPQPAYRANTFFVDSLRNATERKIIRAPYCLYPRRPLQSPQTKVRPLSGESQSHLERDRRRGFEGRRTWRRRRKSWRPATWPEIVVLAPGSSRAIPWGISLFLWKEGGRFPFFIARIRVGSRQRRISRRGRGGGFPFLSLPLRECASPRGLSGPGGEMSRSSP